MSLTCVASDIRFGQLGRVRETTWRDDGLDPGFGQHSRGAAYQLASRAINCTRDHELGDATLVASELSQGECHQLSGLQKDFEPQPSGGRIYREELLQRMRHCYLQLAPQRSRERRSDGTFSNRFSLRHP